MTFLRLIFFVFILSLSGVSVVHAETNLLSAEQAAHARSAFTFADHNKWNDALMHTRLAHDDALMALITWLYALDSDSGASFDDITRFIEKYPDWPEQKKLRLRAEQALKSGNFKDSDLIDWFGDTPPITGIGKLALAEAMGRLGRGSSSEINAMIRDAWRTGDFDEAGEKTLLNVHRSLLTPEDDFARADRLLWEEKTGPAKRMLSRLNEAQQTLIKTRIAFLEDRRTAPIMVTSVAEKYRRDPGLLYDRMRYRARRGDDNGVRDILKIAPSDVPYPEKWWKYRELQVREAIDERNYVLAKKLMSNHGQREGIEFAEASWLEGWLLLEFLKEPEEALDDFKRMFETVRYPVSKARGAYWAGRAAEASGDSTAADHWYATASAYPTTFYGQLASLKYYGNAPLRIPPAPSISSEARKSFEESGMERAAKICFELAEYDLASRFVIAIVESSNDEARVALAAELGRRAGRHNIAVRSAKKALQQNVVLIDAGYPTPKAPADLGVPRPLALAIARQESEFDPQAKSRSGALGLLQLLAATAKETAHKLGISYSASQLMEPEYNMKLGSHYLGRLVSSYDGSYIMAIAAYNAGPGNVRKWTQLFGTPGNNADNAVNWIEKIPFTETRNYVQRVLENLQVYRHIEETEGSKNLRLGEDLVR